MSEPTESISPRLRKIGNYYVRVDDELSSAVVEANQDADPFDLLWKLREEARKAFGDDHVEDTYPDEPIRRIVGFKRRRLEH